MKDIYLAYQNIQWMYNLDRMFDYSERMMLLRIHFRSRMLNMTMKDHSFVIHDIHIEIYKIPNECDPSII